MDARDFHLQLLLTSLAAPATAPTEFESSSPSAKALHLVQQGNYLEALQISLAELNIASKCTEQPPESPVEWFHGLQTAAAEILQSDASLSSDPGKLLTLAAVASLYIFTQCNLTGPLIDAPECPFDVLDLSQQDLIAAATASSSTSAEATAEIGRDSMSPSDRWACSLLAENGEDLVGRIRNPQYLLLSKFVLESTASEEETPIEWSWWAMRTILTQQRVLAGRSAVLRTRLLSLTTTVLDHYSAAIAQSEAANSLVSASTLHAAALLEAAMMETAYGHVQEAKIYTDRALVNLDFHAELGGALGVRTVHQQDPHAQLILRIETYEPTAASTPLFTGVDGTALDSFLMESSGSNDEIKGLEDESDVLRQPKLVEESEKQEESEGEIKDLTPLQQAAVLALAVHAKKGSSADGLQPWEVLAHVNAVLQQPTSEFLVRAAAHLQVTRVERQRSRTRERALLDLEGLAGALDKAAGENDSGGEIGAAARIRCAFLVWFPLRISLRKELGEAFVALGLVGAALPLFESLELWDNLIVCYRLLDKKVAAEQLITRRLEVTPDDPRLWCALGDLSLEDKHYLEAWNRSGQRNARAARSLARNAIRHERFADAAKYWEDALALNPLHPEGWFNLGWCYIKTKEYLPAMRALTRAAQMDPDNGEAWNNLAAVHIHLEHWREASAALSEAVKYNRSSWHTWDNYAGVAVKVGEWQTAARAVGQVVSLSNGQRLNLDVLSEVVDEVGRIKNQGGVMEGSKARTGAAAGEASGEEKEDSSEIDTEAEAKLAESLRALAVAPEGQQSTLAADEAAAAERNTANFLQIMKNLMKQIASTAAGDSAFWGEYARYYTALGEKDAAAECLLKRVRALQGGAWRENQTDFEAYAAACGDLCRAYLQNGGSRELSQARMLLRGLLKQASERYEEHAVYAELQTLFNSIEAKMQEQQQQ